MKQLVILSGKGGTGKTTVAAALAHLASEEMPVVLADADVDAANLELVLAPTKLEEHDFMEEQVAGRWFRSNTRFGPFFHAHSSPDSRGARLCVPCA